MADGGKLLEARVGGAEPLLGLVQPAALQHRATENELCRADLVQIVLATLEQTEGVTGMSLGSLS